jgi:hypothetical protein
MISRCAALPVSILVVWCSAATGQVPPVRPPLTPSCPNGWITTLADWQCSAASGPRPQIVHAVPRRGLPGDALHIRMRTGSVSISAGATDSVRWYLVSSRRPADTVTADQFRAGPGATAWEIRSDLPGDSGQSGRPLPLLQVFVPRDLKALQIETGNGDVVVQNVTSEITITVDKGFVAIVACAGPALVENRDGLTRLYLGATRFGMESALQASLSVLGRNGDIEVAVPAGARANLDVEAHQGSIVDAPSGYSLRPPRRDTVFVSWLPPVLGLKDSELRSLHRVLNGGGPSIKLVALNGNVTLHEFVGEVKSP